jgi:hypothetical protein
VAEAVVPMEELAEQQTNPTAALAVVVVQLEETLEQ